MSDELSAKTKARRAALIPHVLVIMEVLVPGYCEGRMGEGAYMNPMENIIQRAILLLRVVRSRTITPIGRANMTRSVIMLEVLT